MRRWKPRLKEVPLQAWLRNGRDEVQRQRKTKHSAAAENQNKTQQPIKLRNKTIIEAVV